MQLSVNPYTVQPDGPPERPAAKKRSMAPAAVIAQRMTRRIADAGLTLERHGGAWRVHGYGVDILTADLANMSPADLVPVHLAGGRGSTR